jgi:hypothetical protein
LAVDRLREQETLPLVTVNGLQMAKLVIRLYAFGYDFYIEAFAEQQDGLDDFRLFPACRNSFDE